MVWQYSPYSFFLFLTAASQLSLALVARRQRRNRVSTLFTFVILAAVGWAVSYGLELASIDLAGKLFWARASLTGSAVLVTIWIFLVVAYAGPSRWLGPGHTALLAAVPAVTVALTWTNELHGLVWRHSELAPGDTFLFHQPGPWLWIFAAISYAMLGASALLLLRLMWRSVSATFRWQAEALLLALVLPWGANFLGLVGLNPFDHLDLTPFAFTFSSLALYLGLKHYYLLEVTPIARSDVINSLDEGVIVVDRAGRILNLNHSAETILQSRAAHVIGRPIRVLLPALGDWPLDAAERSPVSREIRLDLPGGTRHYQTRQYLFQDRDRADYGYLFLLSDISSLKQIQEMREELTHALVHDLRSPVSNLALTLEWLEGFMGQQLADEERELLQSAQHTTEKLLLLVSSILDLERLEAGEMPLRPEPVDVGLLVAQTLQQQRVVAQVKDLTLTGEVATSLPAANADPDLIDRVLQNLVNNATKFTPSGGEVRVTAVPADGGIVVSVQDTGPGIEPDTAAHLFEKYKPGYHSTHGSGLGLAFCKLAVEAHGESIWVESPPDGGTRVSFTLRAAGDDGAEERPARATAGSG